MSCWQRWHGLWRSWLAYYATAHGGHDVRDYARAMVSLIAVCLAAMGVLYWLRS